MVEWVATCEAQVRVLDAGRDTRPAGAVELPELSELSEPQPGKTSANVTRNEHRYCLPR